MPKADPSSRRSPRRANPAKSSSKETSDQAAAALESERMDSDFGLALRLMPALRRRKDS